MEAESLSNAVARLHTQAQTPSHQTLPHWPNSMRGAPNSILRSALFQVVSKKSHKNKLFVKREPIATLDNVTILRTGPILDQADLDVWEECLHLARQSLGQHITFSANAFLKAIGRDNGKSQHEWLKGSLAKLAATVVEITISQVDDGAGLEIKRSYFGPLIHHGTRDESSGRGHYVIEINPAIRALFRDNDWSKIDIQKRLALKKKPLAQWLYAFYATHAKPYPIKVETIHRLCGSEAKLLSDFRKDLRAALSAMETVTGWSWKIDSDGLVHVYKTCEKQVPCQNLPIL